MIFKPNMIVVITNGRLAGKKAVVVKEVDDSTVVVAGINRIPSPTENYMQSWEKRKNEKFLTFIKKINVNHIIATRYKADVGLSSLEIDGSLADLKAKQVANEAANKILKSAYESKKAKWLFTSLKF